MLIACTACHRQYDVADLAPGSKVRCACGTLNAVPRSRPRRPLVAYCAHCGAPRAGEEACEYCGASPSAAEKGLGDPCPECFARLLKKAQFCHGCGIEIRPESVVRAITRKACPRCEGQLVLAEGRGDPFHQCTGCGGIWLSHSAFRRFVDRSAGRAVTPEEQRSVSLAVRARRRPLRRMSPAGAKKKRHRPIRCPTCGSVMLVTSYARYSGIEVDACQRHGWWFDGNELELLGSFVAGGGLEEAARRQRSARRSKRSLAAWKRQAWKRGVQKERGREPLGALLLALVASALHK